MSKHVQIKALKDGANIAGIGLKSGQVIALDLDAAQLAEAKANGDLAIDDGTDAGYDVSLTKATPSVTSADNAPKANSPMYGIGIVEKAADTKADDALADHADGKSKNKSK